MKNRCVAAFVLAWLVLACPVFAASSKALVVIDVQEDCTGRILKPPFLYQKGSDAFIARLNSLIESAGGRGVPVIYLRTNTGMKEVPGAQLDTRLLVIGRLSILEDSLDAFASSDHRLEAALRAMPGVKELVLAGLDAALCVLQTAKGGREKGYAVTVLTDCIATITGKTPRQLSAMYRQSGITTISSADFITGLR